jgi:hypothetical protein
MEKHGRLNMTESGLFKHPLNPNRLTDIEHRVHHSLICLNSSGLPITKRGLCFLDVSVKRGLGIQCKEIWRSFLYRKRSHVKLPESFSWFLRRCLFLYFLFLYSSQRIIRKVLAILTDFVSFCDSDRVEIIMCCSNTQKACQRSVIRICPKHQFLFDCHDGSIIVDTIKFAQTFSY